MLYNTEAIVVKSTPYGETHAIISLLTPAGTVVAMARGAKRPQSRLAAGVQMCVQGIYTIYQNTGMGNVQQFELLNARRPVREHLDMAAYAAYFCELAVAASDERPRGSEALYRQFVAALDQLTNSNNAPSDICAIWETKVLHALGASPDWTVCVRCSGDAGQSSQYAPNEGGFLCDVCVARGNGTVPRYRHVKVPNGLPILLERLRRVPLSRLGTVRLEDGTRKAMATVLRLQLAEFAGLSLKARSVLDSLQFDET